MIFMLSMNLHVKREFGFLERVANKLSIGQDPILVGNLSSPENMAGSSLSVIQNSW